MTYAAVDSTVDRGQPYELFEITVPGSSQAWYYTTETEARTYAGHTYAPEAITRGEITREAGAIGSGISIVVPDTNSLALTLLAGLTTDVVNITIRQFHRSDSEARTIFIGTVSGVQFNGAAATISAGPRNTLASKRKVLWLTYQASCNWAWGEDTCGVNRNDFRTIASLGVSAQTGRVLTVPALSGAAAGDYNGGTVERIATGERRFITTQTAGALTLSHPFAGLTSTAETFHVFPGCRNTEADCLGRFNNLNNYLGFAHLPDINPYRRSAYYLSPTASIPDPGDIYNIPEFPGYYLFLEDRVLTLEAYRLEGDTPTLPPSAAVSYAFNIDGAIRVTLTVSGGGGGGGATTVPIDGLWVQPKPITPELLALFEVNISFPDYAFAIPGSGGDAFDTWLPLSSEHNFHTLWDSPVGASGTSTISIRTIADGVVRVQSNFTLSIG